MRSKCIVLFGLLLSLAGSVSASLVFNMNSSWRYMKGTAEASTPIDAWRTNGFNDATWPVGTTPFYYGEALNGTVLGDMQGFYTCIFMRKTFNIADPSVVTGMELRSLLDDGCMVWINGTEVLRTNMPSGQLPYNTNALVALEPELLVRSHPLPNPATYLVAGQNTIAIQAFNSSLGGSADFVIDAQLIAAIPDSAPPTVASHVPSTTIVNSLTQITVTFSEPVSDVTADDLLVNGQPATGVFANSDSSFSFTFPQPAYGAVQITWSADPQIRDYASPPNGFDPTGPGATWQYNLVDIGAPFVASVIPDSNSVVRTLINIEIRFNEEVSNVDASDLLINGVAATNVISLPPRQFIFEFPQPPTGVVNFVFAGGHGITDLAGNPFAGGNWSCVLDTNVPPEAFIITEFMARNAPPPNPLGANLNIRDEDGDYSDWIEIQNTATVAGNLNGWFLTDSAANLTKWRFPNIGVPAGGYLIVFASGKNRTNIFGKLHTNFQLDGGGEYLALVSPKTNVISEFSPTYPPQSEGVSYGRDRTDPNILGFFTTPTPGAPNSTSGAGFSSDVLFSREEGTFLGTFSLTLSTVDPNAAIRFVLVTNAAQASSAVTNVPTATSTLYTNPIVINRTTQVRARAFTPSLFAGNPLSKSYIQINSNVMNFSSDLPLVIIHNFGAGDAPGTGDQTAVIAVFPVDEETGRSSPTNKPSIVTRGGINRRGSSTQGYPKASLAVEFWDEFNLDRDLELLGMPTESDWVFYAPNGFDIPLLHNPFAFELSNDVDRYGSRTRMAEVFMNINGGPINTPTPSSGDYNGIYVIEEKIKINNDRVNIPKVRQENTNAPSITGGYLLKIDRQDGDEVSFTGAGTSIVYQDPDGRDLQLPQWDPQEQYIINFMNSFGNALNGVNYTNPITGYAAWMDIDSAIDHNLLNVITMNVDAFRLSGYFFKDRNKKLEFGPVWDFDRAMGTSRGPDWRAFNPRAWRASDPLGASDYGTDFFNNAPPAWWGRLFSDVDFLQRYIDRYQELRQLGNAFDTNRILAKIDRMANEIRQAQPRDQARWSGSGASDIAPRSGSVTAPNPLAPTAPYTYVFPTPGTWQGEIDFFKKWMYEHVYFMDTNFLARPFLGTPGGAVSNTFDLAMAGPTNFVGGVGATIYYTLNGTDPRLPGGGIAPAAQIYTGPIPISNNVRVFARARNPNHRNLTGTGNPPSTTPWSGPAVASYYFTIPDLRITEIMYHPEAPPAGNTNDADNFEYIEVKNIGGSPLNLAGFRIRGGVDFDFGPQVLAAGQSGVVVANNALFMSRYGAGRLIVGTYTNNHLDNGGDQLKLEGPLREPIHDFRYDDTWYPITDGFGFSLVIRNENAPLNTWGLAASWRPSGALGGSPSQDDPAQPNFPQVVINEVLTHSDPPPPTDTIELLNLSGTTANIGGWFLTDDLRTPKKYRIANGTTIGANGFLLFDESQFNVGPNGFSLSSLGEEVYLFSADANTNLTGYLHGFDFGPAANGVTYGRYVTVSGSEQFPSQRSSTLGSANSGPLIGPIVITEIMYHPPDIFRRGAFVNNVEDEYIELRNITDEAVPLYHLAYPTNTWKLTDAFDYAFPLGVSIPAGGYVIVAGIDPADPGKLNSFRARNGISPSVPIYGPFNGNLDNDSEAVELRRPDNPEPAGPPFFGFVPYVLVERIRYNDADDVTPWPIAADGIGPSLQRVDALAYGNDPANWVAAARTPGAPFGGGSPPAITQQPTNRTVVAFNDTFLSVGASGAGLSYQWRFESSPGNFQNLVGATNATLVLTNVQANQQGTYQVLVLNPSGSTVSSSAFLTVLIPANILQQPQNWVSTRGSTNEATYGFTFSNALFSVSAASSTPISYQWRYNGVNLANSATYGGVNSATLGVTNVTLDHQGTYDCLLTDSVGNVRSAPATLTVAVVPFITRQPQGITLLQGDSLDLSVEHRGTAPFGYRWRRGGVSIFPGSGFTSNRVLSIVNVQTNSTGQTNPFVYNVILTNLANSSPGIPSSNALVYVLADSDGDKVPNLWEIQYGFNPNDPADGNIDSDGDGMKNFEEFRAGTDPTNPNSYLKVEQLTLFSSPPIIAGANITFFAVSNRTYGVEYSDNLASGPWSTLAEVLIPPGAANSNRVVTLPDPNFVPTRYYRLVTPMKQD